MNYRIINKKGQYNVILIHGLFATSGYWLNYLDIFKNFKLLILEIDYLNFSPFEEKIKTLENIIKNEFNNKVDFIFSHSLGTILANNISDKIFKFSFEICPIYCSTRIYNKSFANLIVEKSNSLYTVDLVENTLVQIDNQVALYKKKQKISNFRIIFIPDNDIYFNYQYSSISSCLVFKGDHFDIKNALLTALKFN
jgi:hypothetical protein